MKLTSESIVGLSVNFSASINKNIYGRQERSDVFQNKYGCVTCHAVSRQVL